ncbi:RUN domain-containing protein 1 isoform X1 [Lithobates pipiens]
MCTGLRGFRASKCWMTRKRQSCVQEFFFHKKDVTVCSPQMAIAYTNSILNMIVKDMRPISIVDGQGFREMINTFYPGYTLPSGSHFTKLMEKKYEENFERLKASLKDVKSKIALTTDAWTSIATEAYLGVTCHFINEDWNLTSYNLTTMPLEDRHTAENIANWVEKAAEKFEISMANVNVVVHDNAANVVAALRILEEKHGISSLRCAGHTLQLVVNHALRDPQISKTLRAAKCLVEHLKKSELATTKLKAKQQQMGTPEHTLINDVSVRWNSTLHMISRLLEQRWPVTATLSDPDVTTRGKRFLDLKHDQWSLLEEVEQVLKPFECATVFLSGESYVTASALPPLVKGLQKSIQSTICETAAVKAFQSVAAQEMTSRWERETKFRDDGGENICLIAAALDLRFRKLKFLRAEDSLKVHLKVQALALEVKRRYEEEQTQHRCEEQLSTSADMKFSEKRQVSLLDTLLGSSDSDDHHSNGEDDTGHIQDQETHSEVVRNEIHMYFSEQAILKEENPLKWWKENEKRFPILAMLAKSYLSVPATSTPSERLFSVAGNIVTKKRASLTSEHVDMLTFLHCNAKI